MKSLLICLVALSLSYTLVCQNKVLFIGIDGCRGDALLAANTPNLEGLMDNGTWSVDALNIPPTWSGTGWSSMLTGVWPAKHNVTNNSFSNPNFVNYPHFYNHIENSNALLQTESVVHWGPINSNILDQADYEIILSTDEAVKDSAIDRLTNHDPDILFLHFDDVDHAGHNSGFLPSIPAYITAIESVDSQIGEVLMALTNRATYSSENWLIIVSTDHGGNLAGHGGYSLEEQQMFVIISGGSAPAGVQVSATTSAFNWNNYHEFNDLNYGVSSNATVADFGISDFSIECWVKSSGWTGDPVILSNKDWASGNNPGFALFGNTNGSNWTLNIGDGSDRIDIPGGVINDNQWHHLAATCDRDGVATLYQDGRLIGQASMSDIGNINSGLDFCFGQDGTQSYPDFWNGGIADVRLWNAVMSQEHIESNSCAHLNANHPELAALRAAWTVTGGSGDVLEELGAGVDIQLIGSVNWSASSEIYACVDFSETPRIIDLVPSALKHLGIEIQQSWELDGDCFGILPPECTINSVSLGIQTGCEALTGNYLQQVMVDYNNPDDYPQLEINGTNFDVSNKETSFLLNGLVADGSDVNLVINFPASVGCTATFPSAFTAPAECQGCQGDLNYDGLVTANDLSLFLAAFGQVCD